MSNEIQANGPVNWLTQITQNLDPNLGPEECSQQLVYEVGQGLLGPEAPSFLQSLDLSNCGSLTSLPEGCMPALQPLDVSDCDYEILANLPEDCMPALPPLDVSDCDYEILASLPKGCMPTLQLLDVSDSD